MTELWEILLEPRPEYAGDMVGSVYVPFGSSRDTVIAAAERRFKDRAVAYRRSGSELWNWLEAA